MSEEKRIVPYNQGAQRDLIIEATVLKIVPFVADSCRNNYQAAVFQQEIPGTSEPQSFWDKVWRREPKPAVRQVNLLDHYLQMIAERMIEMGLKPCANSMVKASDAILLDYAAWVLEPVADNWMIRDLLDALQQPRKEALDQFLNFCISAQMHLAGAPRITSQDYLPVLPYPGMNPPTRGQKVAAEVKKYIFEEVQRSGRVKRIPPTPPRSYK